MRFPSIPILQTILLSFFTSMAQANEVQFQCFGSDPFWVATVYQDKATVTLIGDETLEANGELITPQGTSAEVAQNFASDLVVITTQSGQCRDGNDDRFYPRTGIIQTLGENKKGLVGCCQPINNLQVLTQ